MKHKARLTWILAAAVLLRAAFIVEDAVEARLHGAKEFWQVADLQEPVLRLHVIAQSHDPGAKQFKSYLVEEIKQIFDEEKDRLPVNNPEGWRDALPLFREKLWKRVEGLPFDSPQIRVELVEEQFPLRVYGHYVYPPGKYTALQVVIGEGNGDNWWCLLFPPLCLPLAGSEKESDEEAEKANEGGQLFPGEIPVRRDRDNKTNPPGEIRWRFMILERWKRWIGKN